MSSSSENSLTSEGLVRGLGRWDATLLTVGAVIGTGIFITTADIARALPHEGGWACFLVIMSGGIAALAVAFGEYLGSFLPLFSTRNILFSLPIGGWSWSVSGGQIAGALAILVLTAVNHIGLREGATVQNFLAVFRIGSIVAFVGLAFFVDKPASASVVEKLPEINLGTVIVMVLYALINIVYFMALPLEEIAATPRIGETAAAALFGDVGGRLMSFAILVSTFGCLAATILYSPRIYLAMSRDGVFFRGLGAVNTRFHTPGRSLWAQSLWAIVLTLSGTYEQIYTYVIFGGLLFHVGTAGAVIVLRRRLPDLERPYRVWGYPWVPLLFILASILLLANTLVEKPVESLIGLVFIAAGVPAYLWWRRERKNGE
jgi:APA family basic amino acid/polyamine antiporter